MHIKIISLCLSAFIVCAVAYGDKPPANPSAPVGDDGLSALRSLKIADAVVTLVRRDDSPTLTLPDGRVYHNLPPRTIVQLALHPAKRSDIRVEIWLPDAAKWNDRLLAFGNGGAGGSIYSRDLVEPAAAGYAAVTTDMGTSRGADSGVGNPEVWKDFGFRATHLMTVVAKQIVTAFYGRGPKYSYFTGRSTGGQQALQEAQRYPDDYDGIIAGVPAHCRTPLHSYFLWNYQILQKCPFTKSQEAAVIAAGNEYMASRETPPVAGKFVSDPRCDQKDIEAVIALAIEKDPTLTRKHAEALRKLFDGPRQAVTGERIFDGVPIGASFRDATKNLYLFKWVFGARKNLEDINFGADIDTYTAALGPYLNAENPDLDAFKKRGGKLIMVSGSADSTVPYHATLDYYEQVVTHFGSLKEVQSFFRFYIIPGMTHGGGDPGINQRPNMLRQIIAWREEGVVPYEIHGQRVVGGKTVLDMPIYPYPTKTGWNAATSSFEPSEGPRGGVGRIAAKFLPPSAE